LSAHLLEITVKRVRVESVARSFPKNARAIAALEIAQARFERGARATRSIAGKKFLL
jgi:hypothetical protein